MNTELKEELIDSITVYLAQLSFENENTHISSHDDDIDIEAISSNEKLKASVRLHFVISQNYKQVYIPNIYVSNEIRHNGYGKTMIRIIYDIAKKYRYELFLVQMVDWFYNYMKMRGALNCEEPDMLQVVDSTILH
jgi:hypothetical protein